MQTQIPTTTEFPMIGPRTTVVQKFMKWLVQQPTTNISELRLFLSSQIDSLEGNERRNAQRMFQLLEDTLKNVTKRPKNKQIVKQNLAATKISIPAETTKTATKLDTNTTTQNNTQKPKMAVKKTKQTLPENNIENILVTSTETIPNIKVTQSNDQVRETRQYREAKAFLDNFVTDFSNKIREFNPVENNQSLKHIMFHNKIENEFYIITYVTSDGKINLRSTIFDYNENKNNPTIVTGKNTKNPIVVLNKFGRQQRIMKEDSNGTKYWISVHNHIDNYQILLSLDNMTYRKDPKALLNMTITLQDGKLYTNANLK